MISSSCLDSSSSFLCSSSLTKKRGRQNDLATHSSSDGPEGEFPLQISQMTRLDLVNRLTLIQSQDPNVELIDVQPHTKRSAKLLSEMLRNNTIVTSLLLAQNSLNSHTLLPITNALPSCSNLVELNLSANSLKHSDELFIALNSLCCLTHLDLGFNNFADLSGFRCPSTLEHLDLRSNPLDSQAFTVLALQLRSTKLRTLILDNCMVTETSCSDLGTGLAKSSRLKRLSLNHCYLDDLGAMKIMNSLIGNGGTEVHHALSQRFPSVIIELILDIGDFFVTNTSLIELDLSHNNLNAYTCANLADAMLLLCITRLKLGGIGVSETIALCLNPQVLWKLNSLTLMDVSPICLSDIRSHLELQKQNDGAQVMNSAEVSELGCKLDLSRKGFGSAEVVVLLTLIQTNPSLTQLNLRENVITEEGAFELAGWLSQNNVVTSLDLSHNINIGIRGGQILARAMLKNTSLLVFKLHHCSVLEMDLETIESLVRRNVQLKGVVSSLFFETPPLLSVSSKPSPADNQSSLAAWRNSISREKLKSLPWCCSPSDQVFTLKVWRADGPIRLTGSYKAEPRLLEFFDLRLFSVLFIGRDKVCDIQAQHMSISRKHVALVHSHNQTMYVIDLGSVHGTFLNGQRLEPFLPRLFCVGAILALGTSSRLYGICTMHSPHAACVCMPIRSAASERVVGMPVRTRAYGTRMHHYISAYPPRFYVSQSDTTYKFDYGEFCVMMQLHERFSYHLVSDLQQLIREDLLAVIH